MPPTDRGRTKVELFLGPIAATCAGGPTPARQEKITRVFALRGALEKEHADRFEVLTWDLGRDEDYNEGIRLLQAYLREAGRADLAERAAFAVNNVTPAVAVDGRLAFINDCPEVQELLRAAIEGEQGGM